MPPRFAGRAQVARCRRRERPRPVREPDPRGREDVRLDAAVGGGRADSGPPGGLRSRTWDELGRGGRRDVDDGGETGVREPHGRDPSATASAATGVPELSSGLGRRDRLLADAPSAPAQAKRSTPTGGTVAKVAAPQPEPRRTCLDEPGHWARGCLGVVSELALRRGTARARHREGRCRRPWRAVLATLPSTAVAAVCFRARLASEPSPVGERAAREFRPPGGAGKTGTTDPAQPERTSRMVAHYLARGHRRARHRTRRRRPGPGRPPTLALPPPGGARLEACGQQVRPRRPSRRSGGVTGQCHDLSPWRRMPQASRAHLRRRDRPARTGARPSTRPTLDRAAVAIERAEKAISDAEIRTARALLTYATGEWAE